MATKRRSAIWLIEDRGTVLTKAAYRTVAAAQKAAEEHAAATSYAPHYAAPPPQWRSPDLGRYVLWFGDPLGPALAETRIAVVRVPIEGGA